MAQAKVTSYYNTRKKVSNFKPNEERKAIKKELIVNDIINSQNFLLGNIEGKTAVKNDIVQPTELKRCRRKAAEKSKPIVEETKVKPTKSKGKSISRCKKNKNEQNSDIRSAFQSQLKNTSEVTKSKQKKIEQTDINKFDETSEQSTVLLNTTFTIDVSSSQFTKTSPLRTPKRNLTEPDTISSSPSKKKKVEQAVCQDVYTPAVNDIVSYKKTTSSTARKRLNLEVELTGKKTSLEGDKLEEKPMIHVVLDKAEKTVEKIIDEKNPKQKELLSSEVKLKILNSGRLADLKEKLAAYEKQSQKLKDYQSNKYKLTSVISAVKDSKQHDLLENKKSEPAYEKFGITGFPFLPLPTKYKLLYEIFRCADTIVSMLNNRKEICTFEKLKNGVQDMTKKTFTKVHLGQINTVLPQAYDIHYEKTTTAERKRNGIEQHLIVSPNLINCQKQDSAAGQSSDESSPNKNKQINLKLQDTDSKSETKSFVYMGPSCLVERRKSFADNLLTVVKNHHQDFLKKLQPPLHIPFEKLVQWHPKFSLEGVPDIESTLPPEPINVEKCNSALDVLNKIRGTVGEKVEQALQKVADNHTSVSNKPQKIETKKTITAGILKGISLDLLQKVRARESAKIMEYMIQSPEEKKKKAMLERVPELVRIIRNFFISERKAAISFADAVQKISDSYHASLGPDEIEAHLRLIAETYPDWLTLISIRKGLFLKIDKNKDINNMLNNMIK